MQELKRYRSNVSPKNLILFLVFLCTICPWSICHAATSIASDSIVNGSLSISDPLSLTRSGCYADTYEFSLTKKSRLSIYVHSSDFNAYLIVYDSFGNVLYQNDYSGAGDDAAIARLFNAGTYRIEVTSHYAGETGPYTLRLSDFYAPVWSSIQSNGDVTGDLSSSDRHSVYRAGASADCYQLTLAQDSRLSIYLFGHTFNAYLIVYDSFGNVLYQNDYSGAGDDAAIARLFNAGTYRIEVTSHYAGETGPYTLRLSDFYAPVWSSIQSNGDVTGDLSSSDRHSVYRAGAFADCYRFRICSQTSVSIYLNGLNFNAYLILYNADGDIIDTDDYGGAGDDAAITKMLTAGTYYIEATSHYSGEEGGYILTITGNLCPFASLECGKGSVTHIWNSISYLNSYSNPVVIIGPPTYHGTDPGVVRLQNVTGNSFDIRFQEWLYKDGAHTQENIPYLALFPGRHQMANGSIWEAGSFSLSGTGAWTAHAFTSGFPSTPALFLTAQTYNGPDPITVRARNVTNTGFEAALFEEENKMDGHVTEEVGYLAVYSPQLSGTVNINGTDVPYLLQAQSVDHRFVPVLSSDIKLEEEKSKDSEVSHINETISILALGDKIFTQDISSNGGDTIAIRRLAPEYGAAMEWGTVDGVDHNWMKIPLAKEYLNPVIVAKPVSSRGGDPGVIRIRNASHNSFELRYNEWAYKDGWHTQERVFYMVVEAGIRSVAGLTVEAGKLNTSKLLADGWESITFSASFGQTPSVFTSVQTYNGADPVTTRLSDCTFAGFDLTMDEEEAKNDGHTTETIGWIAIKKGTGKTNDNRSVVVLSGSTNHIPTQINFGQSMARRFPVVVSDMITTYGGDPGFLRYQNLGPSSIDLFIQEEASSDPEMNHIVEDVSVFVAE